jgi:protein AaeX
VIKELDLFGIYMPPIFVQAAFAMLIWLVLRQSFAWAGLYRFVWHPALFNTALYVVILSACVLLVFH